MPHHTTPRQPLSCENCRKRKIKCSGGTVPCNTCVRRGYRHSCYFKNSAAISQAIPDTTELLGRIRNLEDLLQRQIPHSPQGSRESGMMNTPARTYSASDDLESDSVSWRSSRKQSGTIITSATGHQHVSLHSQTATGSTVSETMSAIPSLASGTSFPFPTGSVSSKEALLDKLPPLSHCDELKNVFFGVFSPLFHVLHDPTFDAVYEVFRSDPFSVSFSWLALLFVILGIAVSALDEKHPLLHDLGRESSAAANMKKLSAKYRSAAMQCLTADQFLYQHNLHTVQALILLMYAMNHANIPSWTLLGMTWNIAVRIGCHIDPSSLNLGMIEGEERRRCWAALMMLYTVQNTCMGNIAPQIFTAHVQLPADVDDEDIHNPNSVDNKTSDTRQRPTKMSYILYKFKLYKIAADICQSGIRNTCLDEQTIIALDQQLVREEQDHLSRFSVHELPTYHVVHHHILQSYTHHLFLVLHRPMLNTESNDQGSTSLSHQRCKSSAITILQAYGRLCDTEAFRPYQWYIYGLGSFHAFLAASILTALLCKPRALTKSDEVHLRSLVEQCIQRFESMASRSDICTRASVILRQILPEASPASAGPLVGGDSSVSSLTSSSRDNFSVSSLQSERQPLDLGEWNFNPELEALLFDATPQQWIAPNSFMWGYWDNLTAV